MSSVTDRNQRLAQAFKFSSADLLVNQQGKVSESQKPNLEMYRRGRVMSLVAFAVVFGIFLFVCLGAGIWALLNPDGGAARLAIPLAMGFGLLAVAGGAANFFFRTRELITSQVSRVEGPAKPLRREYAESDYGYAGTALFVKIGPKGFPLINEEQFNAFEEDAIYRAYYVKNYPKNVLLTLEAL